MTTMLLACVLVSLIFLLLVNIGPFRLNYNDQRTIVNCILFGLITGLLMARITSLMYFDGNINGLVITHFACLFVTGLMMALYKYNKKGLI